jgi:hypothetical protein
LTAASSEMLPDSERSFCGSSPGPWRSGAVGSRRRRGLGVTELWRGSLGLGVGAAEGKGGCAEGSSGV